MATKDYSSKQESMIADSLGWSVVAGSGAAACYPGDIISDEWLGECKTHLSPGKKIFFSKKVWKKIQDEAMVKRRFPVLFTDDGSQKSKHTWCLFEASRLDTSECTPHKILKLTTVNFSFDSSSMMRSYQDYIQRHPDEVVVLTVEWDDVTYAVTPLSLFIELFGE